MTTFDRVTVLLLLALSSVLVMWQTTGQLLTALVATAVVFGLPDMRPVLGQMREPGAMGTTALLLVTPAVLTVMFDSFMPVLVFQAALVVFLTVMAVLGGRLLSRPDATPLRDSIAKGRSLFDRRPLATGVSLLLWAGLGYLTAGWVGVAVTMSVSLGAFIVGLLVQRKARALRAADPAAVEDDAARALLDGLDMSPEAEQQAFWDAYTDLLQHSPEVDHDLDQAMVQEALLALTDLEHANVGLNPNPAGTAYELHQRVLGTLTRVLADASNPSHVSTEGDVAPSSELYRLMDVLMTEAENPNRSEENRATINRRIEGLLYLFDSAYLVVGGGTPTINKLIVD